MSDITIRDNPSESRWEALQGERVVGVCDYRVEGDVVTLPHTQVDLEGRGIAGQLAEAALDKIREAGGKVVPSCSYIAHYIDKHPEYRDLLA